jgi:hypothetical protein
MSKINVRISIVFLMLAITGFSLSLSGCKKAPNDVEHFTKAVELLDRYMNSNVTEAEAAMLELEKVTMTCEKNNVKSINYEQVYSAIYSRLFLIESARGKSSLADNYYKMAVIHSQKYCANENRPQLTPVELRSLIESVDKNIQTPKWKEHPGSTDGK